MSCATVQRMKYSPVPVQETATDSFSAYVPAPMIGESPMRPKRLLLVPPVDVPAARLPCCGISGLRRGTGGGIGSGLFRAAGDRAGARGCRWLKIETQNVNVAARRFYQKMGCALGTSDRFANPGQPGEVQLLWWKALESTYTESSRSELRAQPQALLRPLPRRPVDRRPIRVGFKAYAAHG